MGRPRTRSSSSIRFVLNDIDLLTLILLHVPWKTLMSSKCVSKQWLSLITAPHFVRLRNLCPLRASGLFFQQHTKVFFVHLDVPKTPSPFRSLAFAHNPSDIRIFQSCNGLLLCSRGNTIEKRNYYVYSPSTNKVDTLPKHPRNNSIGAPRIALIFDPSESLHYKVISFLTRRLEPTVGDFFVYSSETGKWRVSIQSYFPSPDMWFLDGVYWNGSMHWLSRYSDSRPVSDSLYFNVDDERLVPFPSPPPIVKRSRASNSYFGESDGHLHYTEVWPYASSFSVYEMKSDYSEWFVKYQIDLVPISKVFWKMKHCPCYSGESFNAAVVSVVRRENFKEDSFLVLELPCLIIRYNLVDQSFNVIWDFFRHVNYRHRRRSYWVCGNFKAWQYIE